MGELFPPGPKRKPTAQEIVRAARRELSMREANYPRWVSAGKMKQETADHEIACQKEILEIVDRWYQGLK